MPHQPETPGRSGVSDQYLVRYILGLLPESETERLDEASIADDDMAERLRIVEDDLIDAYVRGNLDGETLERFETYYLSSPARREQVRFAASLVRSVDRAARPPAKSASGAAASSVAPAVGGASAAGTSSSSSLTSSFRRLPVTWLLPGLAAAAVLLLASSATLVYETNRLNRSLNSERQQNAALDQRTRSLAHQLETERTNLTAAQIELARTREWVPASPAPGRSGAPSPAPAIAVVLLPQTRAIGPIPALAMSPGVDRVAFDLRLETNDFREYKVGLRDPATNDVIWRSDWIAPRISSDQASVSLAVPGALLKPQHYAIELTGRDGANAGQVVGSYAFQIVPR